jgi:tetratricopeptide (TPR) repeat protein
MQLNVLRAHVTLASHARSPQHGKVVAEGSHSEPIARGTLAETPLCHVALYLYRRTNSGTLIIDASKRTETRIRFARGRPIAARMPFAREGLLACLLPLCGLRAGVFEFFEEDLVGSGDDVVQGVVDPYEMISASLEDHARDDMVDELLSRFAKTKLRVQPGRDLDRLHLSARDKTLVELIRAAPATPLELIAQAPLPKLRTRRVLYALLATHMVSPHQDREDAAYRSQVDLNAEGASLPINDIAASSAPAWQRLASLRPGNAPLSMRVPGPSSMNAPKFPSSIRAPEGGPNTSLRPPGPAPAQAPASGAPAAPRGGGSVSGRPAPDDHAGNVRYIEQLLMRGRYDDALEAIDKALVLKKDGDDLLGLRALALFEKHRASDDVMIPKPVTDAIKYALELEADNTRALFARGLVLKRSGDTKKALAYFKRVAQLDPRHLEAQREVRLAKLRSEQE